MLCRRHNSALSGVDAEAKRLMLCMRDFPERLRAGGGSDAFHGYDVERWLLKMFCGYIHLDGDPVPEAWLRILFGEGPIRPPGGLHLNVNVGERLDEDIHAIAFETARNAAGERVGCAVLLRGFRFLLSLDGKRVYGLDELGKQSVLRPKHIRWLHGRTRVGYRVEFHWPSEGKSAGDGITLVWAPAEEEPR